MHTTTWGKIAVRLKPWLAVTVTSAHNGQHPRTFYKMFYISVTMRKKSIILRFRFKLSLDVETSHYRGDHS